jgi:uncharacterized protein (DUF58 family)
MGLFVLLIIILAFTAGHIRGELVLTLTGAVFLTAWLYSLVLVLFLGLLFRKRLISVRLNPRRIAAGEKAEVFLSPDKRKKFPRFPGVLLRYQINLETRDGRSIQHLFDPDLTGKMPNDFEVKDRGAYYTRFDELILSDCLGFFRFSRRFFQENEPRILAGPRRAADPVPLHIRSGGTEQRAEFHYRRTDNLIDHRPYIPGDDPRRINWKLYSHGGDLFIREGEPEPPPHSRLLILVDTQADPLLFSPAAARNAVDLLCENTLAAALEYSGPGMDILTGYTGGKIRGQADLAEALALPAALPLSGPEDYPPAPEDRGILILALPRCAGEASALDRFLKKRDPKQQIDLIFLCGDGGGSCKAKGPPAATVFTSGGAADLAAAAENNVSLYGQKPGVRAVAFMV